MQWPWQSLFWYHMPVATAESNKERPNVSRRALRVQLSKPAGLHTLQMTNFEFTRSSISGDIGSLDSSHEHSAFVQLSTRCVPHWCHTGRAHRHAHFPELLSSPYVLHTPCKHAGIKPASCVSFISI